MLAIIAKNDKYFNSIFVDFLKLNTVLEVLFSLIPVNKDLE